MSKLSEILEKNNKFFSEIDEKYKQQKEESQRILDEKLQASRLALKEKLQQISDKYTKLKKSRQKIVVEEGPEKAKENQEKDEDAEETKNEKGNNLSLTPQSLEFENEKHGCDHFPAPSPLVLLPSQATETSRKPPETILAKPPASQPPPKPPDLHLQTAVVNFQVPRALKPTSLPSKPPLTSSVSCLPPDLKSSSKTVFFLTQAFPSPSPPPKPPDLILVQSPPLEPPFNCPPLRPPWKPPDLESPPGKVISQFQFSTPFCYLSLRKCVEFLSLKSSTIKIKYQPFDLHFVSVIQSQPYNKSTTHVRLYHPTICRHVTSQMQKLSPTQDEFFVRNLCCARASTICALGNKMLFIFQLSPIQQIPTATNCHVSNCCPPTTTQPRDLAQPITIGFRQVNYGPNPILLWTKLYSFGPPHTRPARKPPD
jgi:hypothetical protein